MSSTERDQLTHPVKPCVLSDGREIVPVSKLDFRQDHDVFGNGSDDVDLLQPEVTVGAKLRYFFGPQWKKGRSNLLYIRANFTGQFTEVEIPVNKYNPQKLHETTLPEFDFSVSDPDDIFQPIGKVAIGYLLPKETETIYGVDHRAISGLYSESDYDNQYFEKVLSGSIHLIKPPSN